MSSNNRSVAAVITSYNRFDLLKTTLDSFLVLNAYPLEKIIVIEDSVNIEMKNNILRDYEGKVELIYNEENIGQIRSIDKAYAAVNSEFIFHTEDDYSYVSNNGWIQQSIEILDERKDVHQIWARNLEDFVTVGGPDSLNQFEPEILHTATNVPYKMLKAGETGWCGFSWMPHLKRTADYHKMFVGGYNAHVNPLYFGARAEGECNDHARPQGYRGAILINGACNSIGHNVSTYQGKPITGSYEDQ